MLELSLSCSSAKRNQVRAISSEATRASPVEAKRAVVRHSCARRRYSSALARVIALSSFVRYATNVIGDALFQKFKIYKGFGPEFQTEALPTRKSRTPRSIRSALKAFRPRVKRKFSSAHTRSLAVIS